MLTPTKIFAVKTKTAPWRVPGLRLEPDSLQTYGKYFWEKYRKSLKYPATGIDISWVHLCVTNPVCRRAGFHRHTLSATFRPEQDFARSGPRQGFHIFAHHYRLYIDDSSSILQRKKYPATGRTKKLITKKITFCMAAAGLHHSNNCGALFFNTHGLDCHHSGYCYPSFHFCATYL